MMHHGPARARPCGLAGVLAVMLVWPGASAAQPADDATLLHRAAHAGDGAAVARLLDAGGEADAATRHGVTPLALAAAGWA